ncbi:glycosyltransferase family 39 protein [Microbispora sp. ATCC PTA-5024]|uniref:glycosyltransferase family 39 protein n=1 Tax=Microbispora sp. ATCC PTA-5024 TaxID=316330 RepID=UPI0018DECDD9|nr:glycosyltransferase family 39 protein [Microbispora sp. ATCC PTA-5024]
MSSGTPAPRTPPHRRRAAARAARWWAGWAVLAVPALVALVAGAWGIDRGSMWQDEATTFAIAGRSLPELWRTLGHVDAVHGLYYLLVHPLLGLGGGSIPAEVLIRLPSVAGTAAAACGVAALGRRLGSPATGLAAGLVYATAPVVGYYAQEGRSYALVTAAVVLATFLLVRAADRPDRAGRWAAYAAAVALACLLNLFAALALAAHGVTLVAGRVGARTLARWACACAAALLAVLPVARVSFGQRAQVAWLERPGWPEVEALVTRFTGTGLPLAVTALLSVLAVLTVFTARRPATREAEDAERGPALTLPLVAAPLALLPPAVLLAVSQVHPFYQERYVLYAVAGLAPLAGAGVVAAARLARPLAARLGIAAALLALLVVPALPVQQQVRRVDSRTDDPAAAARIVAAGARPGDAVLFLPSVRRLVAEAYPDAFRRTRDAALRVSGAASGTLAGRELPPERIEASLADAPRVWVVSRSHPRDADLSSGPDTAKRLLLREHYNRRMFVRVLGYAVRLYVRKGTAVSPSSPPPSARR